MSAGPQIASDLTWFKSSYSGGNTTECLECAHAAHGTLIRDSKWRGGPVARTGAEAWCRFVNAIRRGSLSGDPTGPQ
ncbi:DUF397 domain-containing protein [Streptomyces sp. LARHCF252]